MLCNFNKRIFRHFKFHVKWPNESDLVLVNIADVACCKLGLKSFQFKEIQTNVGDAEKGSSKLLDPNSLS